MSEQLYRWVKTSERLPETNGKYHCKVKYCHVPAVEDATIEFEMPFFRLYKENYVIEWLEPYTPSPSGVNVLVEALEDLLEAIPGQTDDADWWPDELTKAVGRTKLLLAQYNAGSLQGEQDDQIMLWKEIIRDFSEIIKLGNLADDNVKNLFSKYHITKKP